MYLLLFIFLTLVYGLSVVVYRLFFHPLAKHPGPFWAKITDGFEIYHNINVGGGLVTEIERLHKLYGPVVRVGPNTLHFNYPQAYHDIYTYGSTLTKEPGFYHGTGAHVITSTFSLVEPHAAKVRRGIMAPLFSRRAIIEIEYEIQEKIDKFIDLLEQSNTSPTPSIEMATAYRSLTLDIITSYCFAECPNTLIPGFSHPLVHNVTETFRDFWIQRHFPIVTKLVNEGPQNLILWLFPKFKPYAKFRADFERQIDKLIADPDILSKVEHETIYSHLLAPKGSDRLSRDALLHEAMLLTGAGSDTIGNASYVGTFYALKHKEIRSRLFLELSEAWPEKDRPFSSTALEKLPYLTAFIKEAFRFSVGVIHPLPRVVNANTPSIGNLKLPPGTIVEMSALFMHMDPNVFPDPEVFNPDRWLGGEKTEMMQNLVPFSKGPRICVGLNLAWTELYLIFGNLFRKLDLELIMDEDTIDEFGPNQRLDYFVMQWRKGYRVSVAKADSKAV